MNLKDIKDIINLMNENGLTELEVERGGMKIKIKKTSAGTTPLGTNAQFQVESSLSPKDVTGPSQEKDSNLHLKEITAPMVGTFYRAPSPEAVPFVEIGQVVEVGQVVCIVEAMKLMNEIKSEIRGKVVEILLDNAEPVEFGQPLFILEPV